ncbi:restriction endonuclease subunit S [Halomonas sp.]|uniref:restriction endonuclease subunit S n=1 Tax=Halomonas sp. TaxID=1486246 RepID=UPI003A921141
MSYPAYPEYKDSGVEWLGEVPAHWGIKKFRYLFQESGEKIEDEVVGEMLSVSGYRGIEVKKYEDENKKRTDSELSGYRIVRPSQLVVNTMWLNYAGLGVSSYEGHVSPAYRSYWINSHLNKRFIHHLMRSESYVKGYTKYLTGIRPNSLQMSRDDLMSFPVLIPYHYEQDVIASFLDHETARIDALVEEQQRLIELLKEKRQAVISHAVTKGLDPDVPMKDSGVEWLGEVPAHWAVGPLRWYATIQGGIAKGKSYDAETPTVELPYLRVANVQDGYVDLSTVKTVEVAVSEVERYRLREGDVLMNEGGDNDKLGRGTVWKGEVTDCLHQNHVFAIRPNHFLLPHWLSMFTRSNTARAYFYLYSKQSTNLASISSSSVMTCPLPLPPVQEQRQVLDFLAIEAARLDDLMQESIETINLLQERRSALISAAVTGKIDVRGWQPPEDSVLTGEAKQMEAV